MKLFAILLGALALVAGFSGGLRAYSVSADAGTPPVRPVSAPHYPKAQPVRPGIVFRYAPCRRPAHRVGKACVTEVTRTITLPAPAAAAPATPVTQAVHTGQAPRPRPTHAPSSPRPAGGGGEDGGGGGGGYDD